MDTSHCFTNLLQGFSLWKQPSLNPSDGSFSCWSKGASEPAVSESGKPCECIKHGVLIQHGWNLCVAAGKTEVVWPLLRYGRMWKGLNYCLSSAWFDLITWSCRNISRDLLMGRLALGWNSPSSTVSSAKLWFSEIRGGLGFWEGGFFLFAGNFSMEKVI